MKRILYLLTPLWLVFLLAGCEALLNFNLFAELDTPKTPSADAFEAMAGPELLSTVTDLVESDSFFEDMANDEEIRNAVIGGLTDIYADGSTENPADKQRAALLVAEIELNTTPAGEVVDDFVNVLAEFVSQPPESGEPEEIVETMVGQIFSGVTAENFDETLAALLAAGDAYTYYGESLDDSGEVVNLDGTNPGAIAQDAVVAILISEIVDVDGDQPELLSPEELEAIIVDDAPFPEDFAIAGNPLEENVALVNILNISGLNDLFSM